VDVGRRRVPLEACLPPLLTETDNIYNVSGRGTLRFGITCHDQLLTFDPHDDQRGTCIVDPRMTKSLQATHKHSRELISYEELPTVINDAARFTDTSVTKFMFFTNKGNKAMTVVNCIFDNLYFTTQ